MLPLKSSLPRFRIGPVGIAIACAPLVLLMYWLFGKPNTHFRSSDSNWASREYSFKGIYFEEVAYGFELYRLKCQADTAQLVRTTKIRWWNVFAWPSYATDPKWNVPYGVPDMRIEASPQGFRGCAILRLTSDEMALAQERAAILVQSFARGA